LLDFAAIGVINAVAEINIRRVGFFDDQNLICTDAKAAVSDMLPLFAGELYLLINRIDHDKIIAGAMHFGEFEFHGCIISRDKRDDAPDAVI
jgi:hypothetical protein